MTQNSPTLPENTAAALEKMVLLTEEVIAAFENETNSIALGEGAEFLQASKNKKAINALYESAAKEFLARNDEFRLSRSPLLQTLLGLQAQLKAEARINMEFLEPLLREE